MHADITGFRRGGTTPRPPLSPSSKSRFPPRPTHSLTKVVCHRHRMSPIQFVKSMRLHNPAMRIAGGTTVSGAMGVGYVSASQFNREFKRMYGQSPRAWGDAQQMAAGLA
ncbi:AraC family transcriptional regulator [Sulfitobacter sp. NFXS29]|uniref:helix-turn-helix domain-containing protein n=1 Tax=Sulfitobacter sp. NFXS29 TaxID=2818438 RepID=UPI0032DF2F15